MEGLADGGPTRSGHPTPPVLVTLPTQGMSEEVVRANAWMVDHYLACGVHGFVLCHAETPGAVRALVETMRFPFNDIGVGADLGAGRRGAGSAAVMYGVWSIRSTCVGRMCGRSTPTASSFSD